jgi:hypothetical protein
MIRVTSPPARILWSALALVPVVVARWRRVCVGLIAVAGLVAAALTIGGGMASGATLPGIRTTRERQPARVSRRRAAVTDAIVGGSAQ